MRTRAAILVEQHAPLVIDEVVLPEPTFGQVLVRIEYSGVCGSQVGEIDGKKGPDRWLPHLLGHEGTGTVEAVGPCVTTVRVGERVILHWRPGAGVQGPTPTYEWGGRRVNAGWVTTFQDLSLVSENRVTPLPAGLDPESGVLYGCALTTAFGVIGRDARVRAGESVVIYGAGGVGASVIVAARLAGAWPVVAVDVQRSKLELARRLGATHVVQPGPGSSTRERVLAALGATGADVVIETSGVPEVMEEAHALTSAQGRTILVGVPPHGYRLPVPTLPLHFGKLLTGSHGGAAEPTYDIPRLARLQQAGGFDPAPLITHRFGLEQINDAIEALRGGAAIRCVVRCAGAAD